MQYTKFQLEPYLRNSYLYFPMSIWITASKLASESCAEYAVQFMQLIPICSFLSILSSAQNSLLYCLLNSTQYSFLHPCFHCQYAFYPGHGQENTLDGMPVRHRAPCTNVDRITKGNVIYLLGDAVLHLERWCLLFKMVVKSEWVWIKDDWNLFTLLC